MATPNRPAPPHRVVFVTGRLAEPALRRVLAEMAPPFAYDVAALGITVAALMTAPWIADRLRVSEGTDLVLIPGLCEGDAEIVSRRLGVAVQKGPDDLRQIPAYFGRTADPDYGRWDIEIVAEINNAPKLTREAVRQTAEYFHACGADVIDIGCTPGLAFPELADVVRELKGAGLRVSVDTFDPHEIRAAVAAGAELVLSVNGSNLDAVRELGGSPVRVVVVPDLGGPLDTLEPSLEQLARWGVAYLIDPILEPIGHAFMASLERYAEVRRRHPDAEILMGVGNVTELTAADTTGVHAILIGVCQDLSSIKRMELHVRQADRLATIGRLSANIAHEIRNPLASLSGAIEALVKELPQDPTRDRLVEIVLRESERLNRIIRDFLEYARPAPMARHEVNLADLLEEVVLLVEHRSVPVPLKVIREYGESLPARMDSQQLRQAIWNLCINAVQAMPDGGELRVGARFLPGEGSRRLQLWVGDTGHGIADTDLPHIFEPFFSTKAEGSGIGLALVYRVAQDHGGHVEVRSAPSAGATFTLTLPSTDGAV